jgi:UDP-N-acetylglucosamine--N-acetylmuramyl-(pentapeptide) pyrophosphoryl-undecaprenol N-acetylglucosamine transferase
MPIEDKLEIRILVVTGKSGGHIFPAVGFLSAVSARMPQARLLLVLPRKHIPVNIEEGQVQVREISITSFKASFLSALPWAINLIRGSLESLCLFLSFRPQLVVGFGSLSTVPMVVLARLSGARTLIHEQNVVSGRANRFLAGFSDRIAISFAGSAQSFKKSKKKLVLTGNPLRKEIYRVSKKDACDFLGLSAGLPTLLVVGGSQGSRSLNLGVVSACGCIKDKSFFQVLHLCGSQMVKEVEEQYSALGIQAKVFAFLNQMRYAYSAADVVVSRGGATAISEIVFFALPSIIVPYPYAGAHQLLNARALETSGRAFIVGDDELESPKMVRLLESLLSNPVPAKAADYAGFPQDAAGHLAEAALSLLRA